MTWEEALAGWAAWVRAGGAATRTVVTWRYRLLAFAQSAGDDPWSTTLGDCVRFLGNPAWAASTRQGYRSALRSFFGWAVTFGYVDADPTGRLPGIRVPSGVPRPTPDQVFAAALAGADDRARLILLLGAYAGLRRAEIAGLRWDHISGTSMRVVGKGGRVRAVPAHPALAEQLAAERARRDTGRAGSGHRYSAGRSDDGGWLFPGRLRGHLAPEVVGRIATEALGHGWTTHTLRHRFATRAYVGTLDLRAVQQLLGHASPETTAIYAQFADGALTAAVLAAG